MFPGPSTESVKQKLLISASLTEFPHYLWLVFQPSWALKTTPECQLEVVTKKNMSFHVPCQEKVEMLRQGETYWHRGQKWLPIMPNDNHRTKEDYIYIIQDCNYTLVVLKNRATGPRRMATALENKFVS